MNDSVQGMQRERIWSLLYRPGDEAKDESVRDLAAALHISPVTARLLWNRGFHTPEAALAFMNNGEGVWHDPFLMADMAPAVTRTLQAIEAGEKIAIYGDYDVDGVTSVTSLYLYLTGIGGDVCCYIPNRAREGYGMSKTAVEHLAEQGVKLIVTVDTGITAEAEIAHAATLGIDTVVTDHHECHGALPVCAAVVNPHRPDCPYPFKELAGVGVVFKFICACEAGRLGLSPKDAFASVGTCYIDLVAIGTIADVMPLVDENRFIVSRGLAKLDHTDRPGLMALLDAMSGSSHSRTVGGAKPRRKVNSGLIGFGIAPRINAAGRISHAMKAVELLLSEDPRQAQALAEELCEINVRRQSEENRIAEQAYSMIEAQLVTAMDEGKELPRVLVLEDDGWMQGIVGIVSSRITEKYGLPSILISFDGSVGETPLGTDVGKGSGRSIKGLNLVEALADSEDLLVRFGGHELAAGLTVRRSDIPAFRERINAYAARHLTDDMTAVRYEADCEVTVDELTMELAQEIETLEPFGVCNQTPVLMLRDATVQKIISLGAGKHTKLLLYADGMMLQAVWFGTSPAKLPVVAGDRVDLLFQLNINDYQGVRSLQLILQDLRLSEHYVQDCQREVQRYDQVLEGDRISPQEDIVPDRDDIARVYTLLRGDARLGHDSFADRHLLERINAAATTPMGYVKMRLVLNILGELGVCTIQEIPAISSAALGERYFTFEVNFSAPKTCVDSSLLLRRIRGQVVGA